MSDLRTAAQQALEALYEADTFHRNLPDQRVRRLAAMTALRAALAQQAEPGAYGYASRLAVAIWEKHYKDTAPQWKPLDDLMGVLTQIDNMTSGLTLLAQQAEPVEPVAWYQKRGQEVLTSHPACWGREDEPWTPLYTAPPQRKPLTEEEKRALADKFLSCQPESYEVSGVFDLISAVERAHGIKE